MSGASKEVTLCECGASCIYAHKVFDPDLDDEDLGPCEGQVTACDEVDYGDGEGYSWIHCCSNQKHKDRYHGV